MQVAHLRSTSLHRRHAVWMQCRSSCIGAHRYFLHSSDSRRAVQDMDRGAAGSVLAHPHLSGRSERRGCMTRRLRTLTIRGTSTPPAVLTRTCGIAHDNHVCLSVDVEGTIDPPTNRGRGGGGAPVPPPDAEWSMERGDGGAKYVSAHGSPVSTTSSSSGALAQESMTKAWRQIPKYDEDGLTLHFSQGMTDYCWREVPRTEGRKAPSVLRVETIYNRIRLFGMPKGFPHTTAFGFQRFFYISLTSSFISSFASSIGYQSLLNGFFLGSSPQLWMLKDLAPALMAAYLANRVVSYENRPKFWFVVSVLMNNVTVIADMMIPSLVPNHLLLAAILTSTVKQSSALMFFVTRAAALQHFATHNNLAELTKKFNSFGMVTYTIATALGIAYCTYVASFAVQLITVLVCCCTNMVMSTASMKPIAFRILNFTTMSVLMCEYVTSQAVVTPQEISDRLGIRMSVSARVQGPEEREDLLYISPPIDKLLIYSDTLDEDVLYVSENKMFMLALWEPTPVPLTVHECWSRYELPSCARCVRRFLSLKEWRVRRRGRPSNDDGFSGKRLVFLVHVKCTPRDLMTAYLVMYTAVLQHASSADKLRSFVRHCATQQPAWEAAAAKMMAEMRRVGWDVDLPVIDHANFRLSEMIVPPRLRTPIASIH